jgi:hypothetical protein
MRNIFFALSAVPTVGPLLSRDASGFSLPPSSTWSNAPIVTAWLATLLVSDPVLHRPRSGNTRCHHHFKPLAID